MRQPTRLPQSYFDTLTPDERHEFERVRRETLKDLREREPQPVVFAYGTSTPGYYAIIETETKQ